MHAMSVKNTSPFRLHILSKKYRYQAIKHKEQSELKIKKTSIKERNVSMTTISWPTDVISHGGH